MPVTHTDGKTRAWGAKPHGTKPPGCTCFSPPTHTQKSCKLGYTLLQTIVHARMHHCLTLVSVPSSRPQFLW